MNEKIQELVITEKWDDLYDYLGSEELPITNLNAVYKYRFDAMQYIAPSSGCSPRFSSSSATLLTLATQRGQVELVRFLLEKGCELNPEVGVHPLEVLFDNLFSMKDVFYKYQDLSETRLTLIKMLLTHAIENNMELALNKVPLEIKTRASRWNPLRNFALMAAQGNVDKISYLQLICAGENLTSEKEDDIFEIIKLLIKAEAEVNYRDSMKCTVIDHIHEPKILGKLLEIADFEYEFIDTHIRSYKSELIDLKLSGKLDEYDKEKGNLLKDLVKILSDHIFNKFEKKPVVQAFMYYLPKMLSGSYNDKDLPEITLSSDVEEAFIKYLGENELFNLKLTCKAINDKAYEYKDITYVERLKRERETEPASCIMM
ncbi:hypothetical protein I862_04835 [endosymbiont of Acanthamoeba sp. UWC8]|uniref:ankyrin repeat domain-containing protein n=1 Tax=endosymbiont of Acanthamoeba sp. UWC8 TaxID=86106 RepID=UPI0004D1AE45|nr:ankyrin repeat domain-containing protein [endosymbiont of Acanthamoeba sp. UWC8]AIF81525.1 hypothetical protein I862_04835 [endosymbiont of Acanthamoeba sp. UWC8]